MGMWEILEEGRGEYDRDFGMRGGNPMEEAYRGLPSWLRESHA